MYQKVTNQNQIIWPRSILWLLALSGLAILAMKSARPLSSLDLWWHMAFGRHILETGKLIIDHSIFTWTSATPYHVYNAWLAEIILYLIYDTVGAMGLITLGYIAHSSFFALAVYFAIQREVNTNPLTWLIITLGVVLSFIATIVQPELFSFTFMFITVWLYFNIRAIGINAWKLCYFFPVIIILWINSHGAFVMSSVFFLAVAIGELLNAKFAPSIAMPTPLRIHLFFAFFLCIPALLINPFGYELPLYLLNNIFSTTAEITGLPNQIIGFDPTFKYNAPPYYALDYLLIAMAIYVFLIWQGLKNKRIDWVVILAFLAYSLIFTKFVRTTYFLAPIFVFSSLDLLTHQQNSWAWPSTKVQKILIAIYCVIIIAFIGWRTSKGIMCNAFGGNLWVSSPIKTTIPVEEVDYISQIKPSVKKVGNTYEDGGVLIYKLWPNVLNMIDTRYFPFKTWFSEYLKFHRGEDIQIFMAKHNADVWLINHSEYALIDWFAKSNNWTPLFIGPAGIVFGHKSGSVIEPKISPNLIHTDSIIALKDLFQTAFALENWLLAEQVHTQVVLIAKNRYLCEQYQNIGREMQRILVGIKSFIAADYQTAITNFHQTGKFFELNFIEAQATIRLAKQAWDSNDFFLARTLAISMVNLNPKDTINLYNAAITDWQYRKFTVPSQMKISDDITWQFLVELLLSHKEKIPIEYTNIIAVLTSMQHNTLVGKPKFIVQ